MKTNLRASRISQSLAAMFLVGCSLAACTTQEAKSDGGSTGRGGSTGTGGSGSGGSTGNGGSSGGTAACGVGAFAPLNGTLCKPPEMMITDFTYDPDAGATDQVRFGTFGTTLSGGQSAYSNPPGTVTGNVTANDWHIMGSVANFSGFGLYFDNVEGCNMVDASAFAGITFKIWGSSPMPITMGMGILDDTVTPSWLGSVDAAPTMATPGSCIPTSGNGPYYHPGCGDPTTTITVTGTQAAPQTVSLRWADFVGGACKANVQPEQILSVYWQFPWATGGTPYDVDIHLDDMAFIPKP